MLTDQHDFDRVEFAVVRDFMDGVFETALSSPEFCALVDPDLIRRARDSLFADEAKTRLIAGQSRWSRRPYTDRIDVASLCVLAVTPFVDVIDLRVSSRDPESNPQHDPTKPLTGETVDLDYALVIVSAGLEKLVVRYPRDPAHGSISLERIANRLASITSLHYLRLCIDSAEDLQFLLTAAARCQVPLLSIMNESSVMTRIRCVPPPVRAFCTTSRLITIDPTTPRPELRSLWMSAGEYTAQDWRQLALSAPNLSYVNVLQNDDLVQTLPLFPALTGVHLGNIRANNFEAIIGVLSRCPLLSTLTMWCQNDTTSSFTQLTKLPNLRYLDTSNNTTITPGRMATIAALLANNLQTLRVTNMNCSQLAAAVRHAPHLTALHINTLEGCDAVSLLDLVTGLRNNCPGFAEFTVQSVDHNSHLGSLLATFMLEAILLGSWKARERADASEASSEAGRGDTDTPGRSRWNSVRSEGVFPSLRLLIVGFVDDYREEEEEDPNEHIFCSQVNKIVRMRQQERQDWRAWSVVSHGIGLFQEKRVRRVQPQSLQPQPEPTEAIPIAMFLPPRVVRSIAGFVGREELVPFVGHCRKMAFTDKMLDDWDAVRGHPIY